MKTKSVEERFADLMREYERQNEEWERAKARFETVRNVRVRVPKHLLAKLEAANVRVLN